MRGFGVLLALLAAIAAFFVIRMDTSVSTDFGAVNNLGLMNQQQNYLLLCGFAGLSGVLLALFAKASPDSAPLTSTESASDEDRELYRQQFGELRSSTGEDDQLTAAGISHDGTAYEIEGQRYAARADAFAHAALKAKRL